jgi:D-threonate/D-erythronate kinase
MIMVSRPDCLKVVVIADDDTGAADTGVKFKSLGLPVFMIGESNLSNTSILSDAGVLSVSTRTRNTNPETAISIVKRTCSWIEEKQPELIFKKVDSCLRGNVGAEVGVLMDALSYAAAFIVAAYPAMNRTVFDGIQYLNGIPIAESEMGQDPVSPVTESNVVKIINQNASYKSGEIKLEVFKLGIIGLKNKVQELMNLNCRCICFDATEQMHLDLIAELQLTYFQNCLPVGSAGMASGFAKVLGSTWSKNVNLTKNFRGKSVTYSCGSASSQLAAQLDLLGKNTGLPQLNLKPSLLVRNIGVDISSLGIESNVTEDGIIIRIEKEFKPGIKVSPESICEGLAEAVVFSLRSYRPDIIFLSGGDTAKAILDRVEVGFLELVGEPLQGLVCSIIRGGYADGLKIITKAGAFGDFEILCKLHNIITSKERLKNHD